MDEPRSSWEELARRELLAVRQSSAGPGWAYHAGGTCAVEPTVLAGIALLACAIGSMTPPTRDSGPASDG